MLPVRMSLLTKIVHGKIVDQMTLICRILLLSLIFRHRSVRNNYIALGCLPQGHKIKHFFLI